MGKSYPDRGMRNDQHDAVGIMLSIPPLSKPTVIQEPAVEALSALQDAADCGENAPAQVAVESAGEEKPITRANAGASLVPDEASLPQKTTGGDIVSDRDANHQAISLLLSRVQRKHRLVRARNRIANAALAGGCLQTMTPTHRTLTLQNHTICGCRTMCKEAMWHPR